MAPLRVRLLAAFTVAVAVAAHAPLPAAALGAAEAFAPVRAERPFALDATLSDPRWATAKFATGFTDLGARMPATARTESALFYDDTNLYVAFRVQQRVAIVATQKTNDIGFGVDDFVGLGIDTGGNGEEAYFFSRRRRPERGTSKRTRRSGSSRFGRRLRALRRRAGTR